MKDSGINCFLSIKQGTCHARWTSSICLKSPRISVYWRLKESYFSLTIPKMWILSTQGRRVSAYKVSRHWNRCQSFKNGRGALDGRKLFYLDGDAIKAVQVKTEPTFSASKPKILFRGNYVTGCRENPEWDISPDGKRFLMIKSVAATDDDSEAQIRRKINIVLNWFEELKERVPVNWIRLIHQWT